LIITDSLDNLIVLGQTATLFAVGIDDRLVHVDVEKPNRSLPDYRVNAEFLLDRGRQTGGRTKEASLVTVDDLDACWFAGFAGLAHEQPPFADF